MRRHELEHLPYILVLEGAEQAVELFPQVILAQSFHQAANGMRIVSSVQNDTRLAVWAHERLHAPRPRAGRESLKREGIVEFFRDKLRGGCKMRALYKLCGSRQRKARILDVMVPEVREHNVFADFGNDALAAELGGMLKRFVEKRL